LWNEPLNAANPIAEVTFNDPGLFPYYCIPHCGFAMNGTVTVEPDPADVQEESVRPGTASIGSLTASPNPFYPRTSISFEIARSEHVRIEIYDAAGRRVSTLLSEELSPGSHAVSWNGRSPDGSKLPSGIYYARARLGEEVRTAPMVLVQ
jgi:hypothetical protein